VPSITVGDVGLTRALAGLDVLAGLQNQSSFVADITPNDRTQYLGGITLLGSVTTTGDQMYRSDTISLPNNVTIRSDNGTVEMVTGQRSCSGISGLNNALFSFGLNAGGLGGNLGASGVSVRRDVRPADPRKNMLPESQHGKQHIAMNKLVEHMNSTQADASVESGEVEIGDIVNMNCDPKTDANCRAK